ncbi:MAG: vanadium-dependent haloperoxidase [Candidatus Dadabacteria bacterium]|nr:vanadium-dependent haloperoxidase [Candidatus Dadabacteria bacterium]
MYLRFLAGSLLIIFISITSIGGCGGGGSGGSGENLYSVARLWNEALLNAIRIDYPAPTVHSRNLFHTSVGMWDAWAAYDGTAVGYLVDESAASEDIEAARAEAISFAAYRILSARYVLSPGAEMSLASFDALMNELGYDKSFTSTSGDSPAALGNRIAQAVLAYGLTDGANEANGYVDDTGYMPVNEPMIVSIPGTEMVDPNRWQPLDITGRLTQNGLERGDVQVFLGSQWGDVTPFALAPRDNPDVDVYLDPGFPPLLGGIGDAEFKEAIVRVIRFSSQVDPTDGVLIDISPGARGNNTLGTNDGSGYPLNPFTGEPYEPNIVKRGDFGRVIAEFWADGPASETPPGHWNTLANYVSDHPLLEKRIGGVGPVVDDQEWDVKLYLAINGAVHDAAVSAWDAKRKYDYVRPISAIRYMGGLGQSSDPMGPSYDPDGLPLVPGLIEVITEETTAVGERHRLLLGFEGFIAIYAWKGQPDDPETEFSGSGWILAINWLTYQRSNFVTPPFAGYTSGHSTFSRAAAEVLAALTGDVYFPGGLGVFVAPKDDFLEFEIGPTEEVVLHWATYYDASDEAGISRLWGGIHVDADDFEGRINGSIIGKDAYELAMKYFDGTIQ